MRIPMKWGTDSGASGAASSQATLVTAIITEVPGSRMARKSDSCLTPPIKGERRLRNTPILRRSVQLSFGVYNRAVHFGSVLGVSDVESACARVLFYDTGCRTRTAVTIRGAPAQDLIAQAVAR